MLVVDIKVNGREQLIKRLKTLESSFYDFSDGMDAAGENLSAYYSGVGFASQGGVFGATWDRLAPVYAKVKAKENPGAPPLVQTGAMQKGFEHKANKNSVRIYNKMPYFKYHQSDQPRKVIPYRPTMGINSAVLKIVQAALEKDVANKIRKAGL